MPGVHTFPEFEEFCCDEQGPYSHHCPNTTSKVYIVDDGTRHGWDEGEWFREAECRARMMTFSGSLTGQYWEIRKADPLTKPTRRGDCNADACRSFKPGGPRIAALEDVVDRDPGDLGLNYNDGDCSRVAPPGQASEEPMWRSAPSARRPRRGTVPTGTGSRAWTTCRASAPAARTRRRRPVAWRRSPSASTRPGCGGATSSSSTSARPTDAVPAHKIPELYGKGGTAGWTGRAAGIEHVRDRPCGLLAAARAVRLRRPAVRPRDADAVLRALPQVALVVVPGLLVRLVPPLALPPDVVAHGPAGPAALAAHREEPVGGRADADPGLRRRDRRRRLLPRAAPGEEALGRGRLRRLQKH